MPSLSLSQSTLKKRREVIRKENKALLKAIFINIHRGGSTHD